ncbi:hypothetical protein WJX81_000246 [Elliptochloris bilobata]|uniref:FAST kinase leucine-rich domain-containing protein n=1 Tax=Elliptochloris bilobata TaxID=381761 RepID=A0AAW1S8G5_9CHLO
MTGARKPKAILKIVGKSLKQFDSVNLATAMRRLAKLSSGPEVARVVTHPDFAQLSVTIGRKAPATPSASDFAPRILGKHVGNACLAELVARAQKQLPRFSEQNLANTAWALVAMNVNEPVLQSVIAREVSVRLASRSAETFNCQELSNLCWAYAQLGLVAHHDMVQAAARALAARAREANVQHIASTASALARIGRYDDEIMERLGNAGCVRMGTFIPQALSNLMWANGRLMHVHNRLLTATQTRALAILPCA